MSDITQNNIDTFVIQAFIPVLYLIIYCYINKFNQLFAITTLKVTNSRVSIRWLG